jgi:ABC-type branched-subunit amino acid transport system ATPase component/branched-subunit amino acid ABC-type transport system permease component
MLQSYLPYVVVGLVTGAVYGLAGTGLVLTYKTSGIFNFAYGSVAALGVFVFYWLYVTEGLPWPWAAAICVCVLAPAEGVALELLARAIERQGTAVKVVATIGIMLAVLGVGGIWYSSSAGLTVPQYLPQSTIRIGGANVSWAQIIVFAVAVLGAGVLYYYFRHVRLGIAMRGIVDDADLIALTGESPTRVRRLSWIIGTVFATMAGLLISPSLGIDATVITLLVVQTFGAAAIGFFSSLPLTFVGGLLIGVLSAFCTKFTVEVSWLSGVPGGLPFIVLFIVLIFTPARKLAERRGRVAPPLPRSWHAPPRIRWSAGLAALVAFAVIPSAVGWDLTIWASVLIYAMLFMSVGVLARLSGQISLCQFTFAAIGAAAFGHFSGEWHIPWLLALILSAVIAVPVGVLVAIPAIRLPGVFLALATLGLAVLVENVFFTTGWMFGPTTSGIATPQPHVDIAGLHLDQPNGFYYVVLAFTVGIILLVIAIENGRMGRLLRALADSPIALEVHGLNVNVTRIAVFCVSAAIAGVAGVLTGSLYGYSVGSEFPWFSSVEVIVVVLISVGGTPWYAILAGLGLALVPGYVTSPNVNNYLSIVFGVSAIAYVSQVHRGRVPSLPARFRDFLDRLGGRGLDQSASAPVAAAAVGDSGSRVPAKSTAKLVVRELADSDTSPASLDAGLEVRSVTVDFGGVRALDGVSLRATPGQITGLVGPNGAGKTTTFNACSGLLRPTAGHVLLNGKNVTHTGRARRAQLGLGRTFQRPQLFDSLTVWENVGMGREASLGGSSPVRQLAAKRGDHAEVEQAVAEAMWLAGVEDLSNRRAGTLSTGQRRLVEVARALAGPFGVIMLDEPCAGLDSEESSRLGEILRNCVAQRGVGVLLVEHDVSLVRQVCERIYVLDFGQIIFEGTAAEMLDSDIVRAAYLGSDPKPSLVPEETGEGA